MTETTECSLIRGKVSVIIPTYNHRDYISETLNSVFAQTFADYEVIVINDGSPDDTGELLEPLAASGQIRYFEQANQGQAAARNFGLAQAQGEFVAFLDDDDMWPADKLEWQVKYLLEHPECAAVGGSCDIIGQEGALMSTNYRPDHIINYASLFSGCPFSSPGQMLVRQSVLHEVGGWRDGVSGTDDYDLLFRLTLKHRVVYICRLALLYRLHDSNASANSAKMMANTIRVFESHLEESPRRMRKRFRRNGYRFLYQWLGMETVSGFKASLKELDLQRVMSYGKMVLVFCLASCRDYRLPFWIIRDVWRVTLRPLVVKLASSQ